MEVQNLWRCHFLAANKVLQCLHSISHFSIWDTFCKLPVSHRPWLKTADTICIFSAYFTHQWAMLLLDLQTFYRPSGSTGIERITHDTNTSWSKKTMDREAQILASQSLNSSLVNRSGKYGSCKGSDYPTVKENKPQTMALHRLISAFQLAIKRASSVQTCD